MSNAFGLDISRHTLQSAARRVTALAIDKAEFHYVVTPNVEHIVNLDTDAAFRSAYTHASLIVADGWPVVIGGRLLGCNIPERVAGSDLVPAALAHAHREGLPLSVFVLGGLGDVPARAAHRIAQDYPSLRIAGHLSPPFGFERDARKNAEICDTIRRSGANFIIVGLGAPKQEKWVHSVRWQLGTGVALCAGATVDFLAGSVSRAPPLMQTLKLEWLYRAAKEPRRLAGRYAKGMVRFPVILTRELLRQRRAPSS